MFLGIVWKQATEWSIWGIKQIVMPFLKIRAPNLITEAVVPCLTILYGYTIMMDTGSDFTLNTLIYFPFHHSSFVMASEVWDFRHKSAWYWYLRPYKALNLIGTRTQL